MDGDLCELGAVGEGGLKGWLDLTSTENDADLARLISAVSAWIKTKVDDPILVDTVTEVHDGNGSDELWTRRGPIVEVIGVEVDGRQVLPASSPTASGFVHDDDRVLLRRGRFARGTQNVAVTFVAGYQTVPPMLEQTCINLCTLLWKRREHIDISSVTIGPQTTSYLQRAMTDQDRDVLTSFRRRVPA